MHKKSKEIKSKESSLIFTVLYKIHQPVVFESPLPTLEGAHFEVAVYFNVMRVLLFMESKGVESSCDF